MVQAPATADPIANPAIPLRTLETYFRRKITCSHNGVLKTRSSPYLSMRPLVHRKTPPNLTSSPKMIVDSSRASCRSIACSIAWHMFFSSRSLPKFHLKKKASNFLKSTKFCWCLFGLILEVDRRSLRGPDQGVYKLRSCSFQHSLNCSEILFSSFGWRSLSKS